MARQLESSRRGSNLQRRAPLLIWFSIAMAVFIVVLPSALNLPQSNPSTVPEFAPVPSDQGAQLAGGNFSSLGVTSGQGAGLRDEPGEELEGVATGRKPTTKRCVGNPPRQTADPLSPPCVPFFEGSNGGATATGVTAEEVRVLWYFDSRSATGCQVSSRGCEACNGCQNIIYDLAKPPRESEYINERLLRLYQRYFNDRFQTYNRFVHFYVHFSSSAKGPAERRADAAKGIAEVKPFAAAMFAQGNSDAYVNAMADQGVVTFTGTSVAADVGQLAETFRQFPGRLWSYVPTLEQRASLFSSYVCKKVVGHKVSFSGNGDIGQPRVLGLIKTRDPMRQDLEALGKLIEADIETCGGEFAAKHTAYSYCQFSGNYCEDPSYTALKYSDFVQKEVTTIIWAGGIDSNQSHAAGDTGYFPEWVIAGEGRSDTTLNNQSQRTDVWEHARVVTTYTRADRFDGQYCVKAAREIDPGAGGTDLGSYACDYYPAAMQMFTGIQVAGPKLSVSSMDRGFHAIPAVRSNDPFTPACFYQSADYACLKDSAVARWDPQGVNYNNTPGCWRLIEAGRRYLAGTWPAGDVEEQRGPDEPCSLIGRHNAGYGEV